ncbi:MAG: hypothetical protein WAK01_16085 [Methylocystis sp.]
MPSIKLCRRASSIFVATIVAMCSSSLALAQEKAFDPSAVEFQRFGHVAPEPTRRSKEGVTAPARPPDAPAPYTQRQEAAPSNWNGTYVGVNAGAATDEKNGR